MDHKNAEKQIFISYSQEDQEFALDLATSIEKKTGKDSVWIDLFDLSAGDELAPRIAGGIQSAKWFILILSKSSIESRWVKYEASLATYTALEKDDFRIITIRLDDSPLPKFLEMEVKRRRYLEAFRDKEAVMTEVVDAIGKDVFVRTKSSRLFLDRGQESDNLQLASDDAKFIFVTGMQGIGKSSLVEETARTKFARPFIKINIRASHNTELLARQIISGCQEPQPDSSLDDETMCRESLSILKVEQQKSGTFLFIDDAENSLDDDNRFRPYMENFLLKYAEYEFDFPVLIVSSRKPYVSIDLENKSHYLMVEQLPDDFIASCIIYWYSSSKGPNATITKDQIQPIVRYVGGHPLAARLIASYLIVESPSSLTNKQFVSNFKLRVAEYMLRDILPHLSDGEIKILQTIAIAETGLTTEDLTAIKEIRRFSVSELQETVSKLSHQLLITQEADYLRLHPYLGEFFVKRSQMEGTYRETAKELSERMYKKAMAAFSQLQTISEKEKDIKKYVQLSQQLLRYASPAHRLLLIAGNKERAGNIPYRFSGDIREMVFITYQRLHEYERSLEYADEWLKIEPTDLEIALYRARSLRQLGKLDDAERYLINIKNVSDRIAQAKIDRELGWIARNKNDLSSAIKHFRRAAVRRPDQRPVYPLALADLASAYILNADSMGYENSDTDQMYKEAVDLLDEARDLLPRFDENHLRVYIDALMHVGRDQEALRLLDDALEEQPDDPHLCLKKADILCKSRQDLDNALDLARIAIKGRIDKAYITMANIQIEKREYADALDTLKYYKPKNPRDRLFTETVRVKALISLGKFSEVRDILDSLKHFNDPYIEHERILNEVRNAEQELFNQKYAEARRLVTLALLLLENAEKKFPGRTSFGDIKSTAQRIDIQLTDMGV
jgi:tetratricopeptide (TPR) repeat protein